MINWDDFDKIWAKTSPLTPYQFSDSNYEQGWNFVGATPPSRQMWDYIQKQNDEKFKYLRDNFGTPNMVTSSSQMTDTEKVYVYMGSEAGWNSGHWYYYDEGTSSWADGGVYNSVAFVTDTTLSIAGQPADAKATGDALALKSDLAGCTFTGNVSVNADLSVTGDASIGTDLSVAGTSTLTGNITAGGDIVATGDVSADNLTISNDATIGGDLSVTGTTSLTGNVTAGDVTANDVSVANINASNNGTIGGSLSVTGTSSLVGDVTASGDVNATGDVTADNISATTNGTIGGALSVAGASTLTGNVSAGADITVVGDVSSANITASNNATIGGNATVTGSVASASLTTTADGTIGGNLSVGGTTILTGDVSASADLSVAGDSSLTNLSVSGTTALAGTSTAPTPSADDNSTKIATTEYVQTELKPIEVNADITDKRISNIEKLLQGNLYDYQTDTDSKYVKSVPSGAMPYASLDSIGGKTIVWNQLCNLSMGNFSASAGATKDTSGDVPKFVANTTGTNFGCDGAGVFNATAGHKHIVMVKNVQYSLANGLSKFFTIFSVSGHSNFAQMDASLIGTTLYTLATLNYGGSMVVRLRALSTSVQVGDYISGEKISVVDLTALYGAGNEPTTVAEFKAMFPADYYPYNAGTLLSAGVTEVKSNSTNIFDYDTYKSLMQSLSYPVTRGTVAFSGNGLTVTATSNDAFTAYGGALRIPIKPSVKYTLSVTVDKGGGSFWLFAYDSAGTSITNNHYNFASAGRYSTTITSTSASALLSYRFGVDTSGNSITFSDIQLEESETATEYKPYAFPSLSIPAEVRALEGYGWSAGSVSNYIDFERKVYVQRVKVVDLSLYTAISIPTYTTEESGKYAYRLPYFSDSNYPNAICVGYTVSESFSKNTGVGKFALTVNGTYFMTDISDINTFEAWCVGKSVVYELATPVETDISQYLTDNLIEVGAGGTLTFPNANGDDYHIPVPSEVTYMIDLQEAIENGN